jgi:site-specific DNA recombinase
MTSVMGSIDPELVFAFYGRVSTEDNQDPTLSIPRQLTSCERAVGQIGGRIVAHYYDVESGAARFEARCSGRGLRGFDIPIPRRGGLQELIVDAGSADFVAVVCESINRFSRNPSVTFQAEDELRSFNVKLWPIDEPWEESFGSIVLRHVNVGLARGYLYELKVKSRQGLETAARQGRHVGGKPLYGYVFQEMVHPNPHRAAEGRKMRVLVPDPVRGPIVTSIFHDYVVQGLGIGEIVAKLNASLERYPPPQSPDPARRRGEWGRSSVWEILHNPKYCGYQVWNRRRRKGDGGFNDPSKWIWSTEPAHEALVPRETLERAAQIAESHGNGNRRTPSLPATSAEPFALRSFLRCDLCQMRMQGHRRRSGNYYQCEARRRPAEFVPDGHPKMVFVREAALMEKVLEFLQRRVFGPDRRQLLLEALQGLDVEGQHEEELRRLEREIESLNTKIRRQVTNLESEEPGTELAREIRRRVEELIEC